MELDEETDKEWMGARLSRSPYPERWDSIGCGWMVRGGVQADWIDGPPKRRQTTRAEKGTLA